jgi:mono/diheme cytochrome c family protein
MPSIRSSVLLAVVGIASSVAWSANAANAPDHGSIQRGRYLIQFGGCNDCHTPGYGPKEGKVPDDEWLKGDVLGYHGPWGTTYPVNLRLTLNEMSEDAWVAYAHNLHARPPMPSFTLNIMKEADLRDMYRFIRSLGPAGTPAPAYLPPGQKPIGPVISWPGQS